MIKVHRLNGSEVSINADLIETVEAAPDTTISLVTGNRFLVKESVDAILAKVEDYKKRVYSERKVINPIEGFERK